MRIDTQNKKDNRGIYIQEVGVNEVHLPLKLKINGMPKQVSATLTLAGSLRPEQKGIHMSRFLRKFDEYDDRELDLETLIEITKELREWEETDRLYMRIETDIYLAKETPVTKIKTYSRYPVVLSFIATPQKTEAWAKVGVLITSLCPASKENSKYGAHNQRGLVEVEIQVDDHQRLSLETLIGTVENCSSCPIYETLKLEDEKFVTEKAYENPRFVEDLAREVVLGLEGQGYHNFKVDVTNYESIHEHNAYCKVERFCHD